ncbi:MAG: methyltransferase domain-containing protein [Nanoarchaeota archaeon]
MKKLNLGCGRDIKKGYVNVDYIKFPGVDKVLDLNKTPYPFKKNEFDFALLRNILEHLDDPKSKLLEIHRILKPEARVLIRTPHFSSCNVWGDIEHRRGFNYATFYHPNLTSYFEPLSVKITFSHFKFFMRPFVKLFPSFYEKHFAYIFTAVDIVVELKVKK